MTRRLANTTNTHLKGCAMKMIATLFALVAFLLTPSVSLAQNLNGCLLACGGDGDCEEACNTKFTAGPTKATKPGPAANPTKKVAAKTNPADAGTAPDAGVDACADLRTALADSEAARKSLEEDMAKLEEEFSKAKAQVEALSNLKVAPPCASNTTGLVLLIAILATLLVLGALFAFGVLPKKKKQ
jgi:hypothetical protein